MTTFQRIIAGLLLALVVLIAALVLLIAPGAGGGGDTVPAPVGGDVPGGIEDIVDAALPSIVTVQVENRDGGTGQGTGFVIDERGIVATSLHVIDDAELVEVRSHDGRVMRIDKMVGADPRGDLALLVLPRRGLPSLELRAEPPVRAGERVVVIGHSLGFRETVSDGLVSAVRGRSDLPLIQTSAPISPGNSGGPMLDADGRVIGVVRSKIVGHGAEGLAFAVGARRLLELQASERVFDLADWVDGRVEVRRIDEEWEEVALDDDANLTGTWIDGRHRRRLITMSNDGFGVAVTVLTLDEAAPRTDRELMRRDRRLRVLDRQTVQMTRGYDGFLRGSHPVKWHCTLPSRRVAGTANHVGRSNRCTFEQTWTLRPLQGRLLGETRLPDIPDHRDADHLETCETCTNARPPHVEPVTWERISVRLP